MEKAFADGGKIAKFVKVFSLESFPLYGSYSYTCMKREERTPAIILASYTASHVVLDSFDITDC